MLPDRVSNPGPLTYESGALPIALRGPAAMVSRTGEDLLLFLLLSYMSGLADFVKFYFQNHVDPSV